MFRPQPTEATVVELGESGAVARRFQVLRGNEIRYFCGDDTHGTATMLRALARRHASQPMLSRTHGQTASPTTMQTRTQRVR